MSAGQVARRCRCSSTTITLAKLSAVSACIRFGLPCHNKFSKAQPCKVWMSAHMLSPLFSAFHRGIFSCGCRSWRRTRSIAIPPFRCRSVFASWIPFHYTGRTSRLLHPSSLHKIPFQRIATRTAPGKNVRVITYRQSAFRGYCALSKIEHKSGAPDLNKFPLLYLTALNWNGILPMFLQVLAPRALPYFALNLSF